MPVHQYGEADIYRVTSVHLVVIDQVPCGQSEQEQPVFNWAYWEGSFDIEDSNLNLINTPIVNMLAT